MDADAVKRIIEVGEGPRVEFKRCGALPEKDVFETICSFANRFGGDVLLGVEDDGTIDGIGGDRLEIERNIANRTCDPGWFEPSPPVETESIDIDGKTVVRVWVPSGPEVYRLKGAVYDRVADADVRIRTTAQVTAIGIRKQQIYTERHVFPHLSIGDLRADLIERARGLAGAKNPQHPWLAVDDAGMLRSARLYTRDAETGAEGLNRAAVLLLGSDDLILDICPAYRTDAVYAPSTQRRYDDRDTVSTNLIDAYDRLMAFCRKHTDDPFYLEGDRAVDVRDVVCREIVVNTLVHREYLSPLSARLIIDGRGIKTENASRAFFDGQITPKNLSPVPKNPIIAGFFHQIGLAEELGSGTQKLFQYARRFMGADPVLTEGDIFTAVIPDGRSGGLTRKPEGGRVGAAVEAMLDSTGAVTSAAVAEAVGVSSRTARSYLAEQVRKGSLVAVGNTNNRSYVRA